MSHHHIKLIEDLIKCNMPNWEARFKELPQEILRHGNNQACLDDGACFRQESQRKRFLEQPLLWDICPYSSVLGWFWPKLLCL